MSGGTNAGSTPTSGTPETPTIQRKPSSKLPAAVAAVVAVIVIAAVLGVGYASYGWFKTASSSGTSSGCTLAAKGTLLGEGSTLVQPLMSYWASSYWGGGVLTYDGVGSTSGITSVTNLVSDFGATDAPLTSSQITALPAPAYMIPESAGGVVPIFNLPGISHLNFNGTVLAEIFDGTITNWNNTDLQNLNAHVTLPSASIIPVYRSGGSGTTFIFTSFLTADNSYWNVTYGKGTYWPTALAAPPEVAASGNGGVTTTVVTTTDAIGYVDLNYALNAGGGGIGLVENPTGHFIQASVANTASALADANATLPAAGNLAAWFNVSVLNAPGPADYPITSLTYLLVFQNLNAYTSGSPHGVYDLTKAENLLDFLTWAVTVGQNDSALLYYDPLPAAIVTSDLTTIHSITLGTESVPVCVPS